MSENPVEVYLNYCIGGFYTILCGFAAWRTISFFDNSTGGKVITLFYFLIFFSALLRSVLFFLPVVSIQGSYTPLLCQAFTTPNWQGFLLIEFIVSVGDISVYSVFMLIGSFWQNMLQKIDNDQEESRRNLITASPDNIKKGPLSTFFQRLLLFAGVVLLNILLFLCQLYSSEFLILGNSVIFTLLPSAMSIELTVFSNRIRHVLTTISAVNANNTAVQEKRILAITIVANTFFTIQFMLQGAVAAIIIYLWHINQNIDFLNSHSYYWDLYICVKYTSEICVLAAELIVSTVIKPAVSLRTNSSESGMATRASYGSSAEML